MSAVPARTRPSPTTGVASPAGTIRRLAWALGAPVRVGLVGLIRLYRAGLSGWLGAQCRFHPTCSHYAEDAIRATGALRGSALAVWRVLRCGPFTAGGVDPAPTRGPRPALEYENVILPAEGRPR